MYKEDFILNNLQWLICSKTQLNEPIFIAITQDPLIQSGSTC